MHINTLTFKKALVYLFFILANKSYKRFASVLLMAHKLWGTFILLSFWITRCDVRLIKLETILKIVKKFFELQAIS